MIKFIYLFIKNWLDAYEVSYNHYELFNGQPTNMEYTNPYPAIYLEILPITWQNLTNSVQYAEITLRLHIVSEVYSSFDADDMAIDTSLNHLDIMENVYKALDMRSSDDDRIPQLVDHQEFYNINTLNRVRTNTNFSVMSRLISVVEFSAAVRDYSHFKYQNYVNFNLTGITGLVDNSGSTFTFNGNF